jgi:hypothetical protein
MILKDSQEQPERKNEKEIIQGHCLFPPYQYADPPTTVWVAAYRSSNNE